jgi:hypothetical protein
MPCNSSGVSGRFARAQLERIEICFRVEHVHTLGAFEEAHDPVCDGCQDNLERNFVNVIERDHLPEHISRQRVRPEAEGEQREDQRVGGLSDQGAADGARPQPASSRGDFQFGKHERIQEFADEERREARQDNLWHETEHGLKRAFSWARGIGWQKCDCPKNQARDEAAAHAEPDHATGPGVPVHFGQDIAKNVGQWEQERAAIKDGFPAGKYSAHLERGNLGAGDVGNDQRDRKRGKDQVEVTGLWASVVHSKSVRAYARFSKLVR